MSRPKALFVGLGNARVCWYRVVLPGMYLGCDWMGVAGSPPQMAFMTGYVNGGTQMANFHEYDVIVVQQVRGAAWAKIIRELRAEGRKVLYEIDDYVHGIRKAKDHDFSHYFQKEHLAKMEMCMKACDGMICSTEYISRRYRSMTPRTWVCENGLDMGRYRLTRPKHRGTVAGKETVTIGWSGATGHTRGVQPWLNVVERMLEKYEHVCFASIGQNFTAHLSRFEQRVIALPFAALETYPAAMMLFDIALAPAGDSSWYRGKSTLRAMEAAALGVPVIADPHYEDAIVEGETGFVVESPAELADRTEWLINHPDECRQMGEKAREHANENFDMRHRCEQWGAVLNEALT